MIAFARTLARLVAGRNENPFVIYGAPWRGALMSRALLGLALFALVGFPTLMAVATGMIHVPGFPTAGADELAVFLTLNIVMNALAVVPLSVGFFVVDWRSAERLQELSLTPVSRLEWAFGALYWPAFMTGLAMVSGVISGLIAALAAMDGDLLLISMINVFLLPAVFCAFARVWIRGSQSLTDLVRLAVMPFGMVVGLGLAAFLAAMTGAFALLVLFSPAGVDSVEFPFEGRDRWAWIGFYAILIWVVVTYCRMGFHRAGDLYFKSLDGLGVLGTFGVSVPAAEMPKAARDSWTEFLGWRRAKALSEAAVAFVLTGASLVASFGWLLETEGDDVEASGPAVAAVLAPVLCWLAYSRRQPDGRVPICLWYPRWSVLALTLPASVGAALGVGLVALVVSWRQFLQQPWVVLLLGPLLLVVILIYFLPTATMLLGIFLRWPKSRYAIAVLLLVGTLVTSAPKELIQAENATWALSRIGVFSLMALVFLMFGCATLVESLYQRVLDRMWADRGGRESVIVGMEGGGGVVAGTVDEVRVSP